MQVDTNGYRATLTDPASQSVALTSTSGGLLTTLTDPRGNVHRFAYVGGGDPNLYGYVLNDPVNSVDP